MTDTPATSSTTAPPRPRRRWWRAVRRLIAFYLVVCVVIALMQSWLVFPGRWTQGRESARVQAEPGREILSLALSDGTPIAAMFGAALDELGKPHPRAASRPTFLFFYGNGMCMAHCDDLLVIFRSLGVNVMIVDYPGYGMSGGTPSERAFYQAADTGLAHLRQRADIDASQIIAVGWSIGTGVAIDLASREKLAGLIAVSPFTSFIDAARHHVPFLPVGLMLRHRFDNLSKIDRVQPPVLIVHGTNDRTIPHEMTDRLAERAPRPVRVVKVGSDHNDLFAIAEREVLTAMKELVEQVAAGATGAAVVLRQPGAPASDAVTPPQRSSDNGATP